jgi:demethylmenaquinone methyltransferase/2-methoxy-6-polyprenyl-1,4-benzoquinol methylase
MLQDAAQRQKQQQQQQQRGKPLAALTWVQGDALNLPFSNGEFDAITMGYGLRNVADIPQALQELQRVLRPGGKAAVLDFNNSSQPVVDAVQVRRA